MCSSLLVKYGGKKRNEKYVLKDVSCKMLKLKKEEGEKR